MDSFLAATLRYLAFAVVAVAAPGVSAQRLLGVRPDIALIVPLGTAIAAGSYWLSLATGLSWLFPALVVALDLALLLPGAPWPARSRRELRSALAPAAALVAVLAATQYRWNRLGADGEFLLDPLVAHDTAFHVGLTRELTIGYPPQVPGLAGFPLGYHLGTDLVRAAALRWAAVEPYDSISRFDVTLWGIALILALRAAVHALGLGAGAIRVAGFFPLATDLSFVPGLLLGSPNAAMKLGGNFVEAVLFANSISPAMSAALAGLVALARAERGEGRGFYVLAGVLGAGSSFLKAFTGAQLLLALGLAWLVRRTRHDLLKVAVPVAAAVALLAFGTLAPAAPAAPAGVRISLMPFAPANPARIAFGLPEAHGLALAASGLAWVALSLGLRVAGVLPAWRALRDGGSSASSLGALALSGWPIALVVSVTADPAYDESFYFLQASGLALWLFAAPTLLAFSARSLARAAVVLLLTLPATVEVVARRAAPEPERIGAPTVRAMAALRAASCPGDVVLTRPGVVRVPPVVVLAGRRVPLASFIPYWRQFTTPETVAEREAAVFSFFRAGDAASAVEVARRLGARYVHFGGPPAAPPGAGRGGEGELRPRGVRELLEKAGALVPVYVEPRAAIYRIAPLAPTPGCHR